MNFDLLQFFKFEHLPPNLQQTSQIFSEAATSIVKVANTEGYIWKSDYVTECYIELKKRIDWVLPNKNIETDAAMQKIDESYRLVRTSLSTDHRWLRLLLEAKDCAVRSMFYKEVEGE